MDKRFDNLFSQIELIELTEQFAVRKNELRKKREQIEIHENELISISEQFTNPREQNAKFDIHVTISCILKITAFLHYFCNA